MPHPKSVRVFLLIVAIVFTILAAGNLVLRFISCQNIDKPVSPPTAYSSDYEIDQWIGYKKFCRPYAGYFLFIVAGGFLIREVRKLSDRRE